MKVFITAAALAATAACILPACSQKTDYSRYISERRSEIYLYCDDAVDIKIQCVSREQPYAADGICGQTCDLMEIYVSFAVPAESAEIAVNGVSGEMNYEAVDERFSLVCPSPPIAAESAEVRLVANGEEKTYTALAVKDKGTISCEQAVNYAAEYDRGLFESLTVRKDFKGEINVRLLYDDGCYYYVGVCDRNKNISAYLIDGVKGKVITAKKLTA